MIYLELKYNRYYNKNEKTTKVAVDNKLIEDESTDEIKYLISELERVYLNDYDNLELLKNKNIDCSKKIVDKKIEKNKKKKIYKLIK